MKKALIALCCLASSLSFAETEKATFGVVVFGVWNRPLNRFMVLAQLFQVTQVVRSLIQAMPR